MTFNILDFPLGALLAPADTGGFPAVEHRHVGLEVAAGGKDPAGRHVPVTGKDGILHKIGRAHV